MHLCDWHSCLKVMRLAKTVINHDTCVIYILPLLSLMCTVGCELCLHEWKERGIWILSRWPCTHGLVLCAGFCDCVIKPQLIIFPKLSKSNLLNVWSPFIILKPNVFEVFDSFPHLSIGTCTDILMCSTLVIEEEKKKRDRFHVCDVCSHVYIVICVQWLAYLCWH